MAETLGSLMDKLSIKNVRLWHLKNEKDRNVETAEKIGLVDQQRKDLIDEIDNFLGRAIQGEVKLRDEKVKLYNQPQPAGPVIGKLGDLVDRLACKNLELWHLEDEVRKTDVPDPYLVKTKRKIDQANQERNDLIDKIDESLEKALRKAG